MKIQVIAVGRSGRLLADAIREYEDRASRYWPLEVVEVKEEPARRGTDAADVRRAESSRSADRIATGLDVVALTRRGKRMSSKKLSAYLQTLALQSMPGAAFVIGGAYGLSGEMVRGADRTLSLSSFTMPHDLARLVLAEQLYRAGTIARNEPYHKGAG